MTKTCLLLTDSPGNLKQAWSELVKLTSLNLETLEWSALLERSRAVTEVGMLAFSYEQWEKLSAKEKESLRSTLEKCYKIIELKSSEYESWKQDFSCSDTKTLLVDFDCGVEFWRPNISSFLKGQELHNSQNLFQLGESLNQLIAQSLQELQRVKKIHETLVPLREERMKGLSVWSKFAAGEASGGEFYDVIEGDEECVVILSHSTSYVVSSLVLTAFESFREKKNYSLAELQKFSVEIGSLIKSQVGGQALDGFQLFIARVDMKSLVIEGLNWGHSQLVSSGDFFVGENDFPIDSSFVEKASFKNKLARSEKYVLFSPGLRANCDDFIEGERLVSYSRRLMREGPKKTLQEVFYQLKKRRESSFLKYDATSVFIEVDPNVIVQI